MIVFAKLKYERQKLVSKVNFCHQNFIFPENSPIDVEEGYVFEYDDVGYYVEMLILMT